MSDLKRLKFQPDSSNIIRYYSREHPCCCLHIDIARVLWEYECTTTLYYYYLLRIYCESTVPGDTPWISMYWFPISTFPWQLRSTQPVPCLRTSQGRAIGLPMHNSTETQCSCGSCGTWKMDMVIWCQNSPKLSCRICWICWINAIIVARCSNLPLNA